MIQLPSLKTNLSLIGLACLLSAPAAAQSEKPEVQGTLVLQTAETSTFALALGDVGRGSDHQDMALFQFNNLFTKNDGVNVYGWQTIDRNGVDNWIANASYKRPLLGVADGTISASTGVARWEFPLVGHTDVWVSDNALYYDRPGKFPIAFVANTISTLSANRGIADGSYLVLNATTSVRLGKVGRSVISLRHGPTYVYGLGMYGVNGSHAFHYEGALGVSVGAYSLELLGRPQIGLQTGVPDSIYWGFSVSRAVHLVGPHE